MDSVFQFLTVLLLFVFVLVITYLTTRWIAKVQKGQMAPGANLEVVETLKITSDKYIQIVRSGNKYLVVGIGKNEINFLSEVDEADLIFKNSSNNKTASFASILDKFKKKNEEAANDDNSEHSTDESLQDVD